MDSVSCNDGRDRHEIMNLFLAGHETTANGVAFAFYLLATHPEIEQKFSAEIDTVSLPVFSASMQILAYIFISSSVAVPRTILSASSMTSFFVILRCHLIKALEKHATPKRFKIFFCFII